MGLFDITSSGPTSQEAKVRPITFKLFANNTLVPTTNGTGALTLLIRPEDLQWTQPSRTAVQQTLGGAWVDTFGEGVATIVISGHTGWRSAGTPELDWEKRFIELNEIIFKNYHKQVADLKDPSKVELQLIDTLDKRAVKVVPNNFVLKRNKSRPLLMQYNISLTVVGNLADPSPVVVVPDVFLLVLSTVAKVAAIVANVAFLVIRKSKPGGTINKIATLVYKVAALVFSITNTVLVVKALLT